MRKSYVSTVFSLILVGFMAFGCKRVLTGGAIGAGAGAVVGGIVGKQYKDTAKGAIIGAAIGGAAGAVIGNYMDKQAEEMQKDIEGAKVERVGEGIMITFSSGILFKTNSADLEADAKSNIEKLAKILNKYPDTEILVDGHTDSDGTEGYNQKLSERRAASVAGYAQQLGVSAARMTTRGFGETKPVAVNDTAEGKQQNRRVEIAVMANEKLKKAAQEGKKM